MKRTFLLMPLLAAALAIAGCQNGTSPSSDDSPRSTRIHFGSSCSTCFEKNLTPQQMSSCDGLKPRRAQVSLDFDEICPPYLKTIWMVFAALSEASLGWRPDIWWFG